MEDLVVVKSTSIVHPQNFNQSHLLKKKIHLTPWDLMRLRFGYPQRGLFFPKPNDSLKIDTIISNLKPSLSIALNHFHLLAARLVKEVNENDDTVSFFVIYDDGGFGVKFVHAEAKTIAVNDLVKSGFVETGSSSFFPANGIKNYQGVSNPLLMVQVTEIKDAVFIGFGYNHTVADGKSIWNFINAWSKICSNDLRSRSKEYEHLHSLPIGFELEAHDYSQSLRGWFLDGVEYPIHIPDPEIKPLNFVTSTTSRNVLQEIVFRFTKEKVLKLKAKANEEIESYEEDRKISSFQAVLGHIWRLRVKHSGMSREEETHCRVPIDMRQRLNPKLKEDCFGNVIQTGVVTVNVGEMVDHGLGWLALRINQMVKSQTDENAKRFADNWVKNVEIPVEISCTLLVTSCPRFNVYGNDFGWGKPIGLHSGPPFSNGKLVVFHGVEEGGFEFQAYFPPEIVVKLLSDVEFLEYVDIIAS